MESSRVNSEIWGVKAAIADMGKMLKGLDLFAAPLPQFNVRGEQDVKTHIGGFVSLLMMTVTFIFAMMKLQNLFDFKNPAIAIFKQEIEAGQENSFEITDDFQMAFGLDTYENGIKNDERYVKWVARHSV